MFSEFRGYIERRSELVAHHGQELGLERLASSACCVALKLGGRAAKKSPAGGGAVD